MVKEIQNIRHDIKTVMETQKPAEPELSVNDSFTSSEAIDELQDYDSSDSDISVQQIPNSKTKNSSSTALNFNEVCLPVGNKEFIQLNELCNKNKRIREFLVNIIPYDL